MIRMHSQILIMSIHVPQDEMDAMRIVYNQDGMNIAQTIRPDQQKELLRSSLCDVAARFFLAEKLRDTSTGVIRLETGELQQWFQCAALCLCDACEVAQIPHQIIFERGTDIVL